MTTRAGATLSHDSSVGPSPRSVESTDFRRALASTLEIVRSADDDDDDGDVSAGTVL